MLFRDLTVGQYFDFVDDQNRMLNSFYDRCIKISARKYRSTETQIVYTVGSIDAKVYHIASVWHHAPARLVK